MDRAFQANLEDCKASMVLAQREAGGTIRDVTVNTVY
jgi:hypothetical protein